MLDTGVTEVWTIDDEIMPVARAPAPGRYDLRDRRVCGQDLDNGYEGWSGEATLRWPNRGRGLEADLSKAPRFQLYSPAEGGLIAAEPVTNANAALNHPRSRMGKPRAVAAATGRDTSSTDAAAVSEGWW